MVEIAMSSIRISNPTIVTFGNTPPINRAGMTRSAPPKARLYPVPTNTSTRLPNPLVISEAKAEQRAFRMIIPSPSQVKCPLSFPPRLRARIPIKPSMQPNALRIVILSLLKNMQANITTVNTPIELSIAARAPSLCDSPK